MNTDLPMLQATRLLTASSDKTCRLWDAESGECLQVGGEAGATAGACTFIFIISVFLSPGVGRPFG